MKENVKLILSLLLPSTDNLCDQFGPRSDATNVGHDLDLNHLKP